MFNMQETKYFTPMILNFGRQITFPHSLPLSCPGEAPEAMTEESSLLRLAKEMVHQ